MNWNKPPDGKRLFRYLTPKWAAALCEEGNLLIGTLEGFREQEGGPQADRLDGAAEYLSGEMFFARTSDHPEELAALARAGIIIHDKATNVSIEGNVILKHVSGAALCFCRRPDNDHFLAGEKTGVVEVLDVEQFAETVMRVAGGRLGSTVILDDVRYWPDRSVTGSTAIAAPNAFIKHPDFEKEEEFRMYWPEAKGRPFVLTDPRIAKCVRRVA